jgi:SpoVK/Ycf46/Vps4 family AAA+-type ATPase
MSPVVVLIDELEKILAGSSRGSSDSDGGAMRRILGSILTWLQDRTNDSYVIGTCNEVEGLPPELLRAGRFDAVFFMDFPTFEEKQQIWKIYRAKYNIPVELTLPDDTEWTGTEIAQCCYFSKLWGQTLVEAADCIVPVARASQQRILALKQYATNKFLDATLGGLYTQQRKKS